ncbi:MAG: pilus assembly protein TadG-related protein [Beijerinckiaceae bacterium]
MSILHRIGTHLHQTARRLVRKQDGNVTMLFGLALMPLMAATGAAVDYSRASDARTQLQVAIDSTVLAMAKRAPLLTDAQLRTEAEKHFQAVLKERHDLAALPISVTRKDKKVQIAAAGVLPTTFMKLLGVSKMDVASLAEAGTGQRKVELALVLDNTGSMGRLNKMDELKKATRNLLNAAEKVAPMGSGMMKVALVPFDTEVNVNPNAYRFQSWLAFNEDARDASFNDIRGRMATRAGWNGCLTDRGVGFESNDKRVDMTRPESLHPAVSCTNGSLARMQPLTDNWSALRAAADTMRPSGCTNITIGARYGMAALSPSEPIGGGVPFTTADVDKYMVILTDGDNTRNRFLNGCGGPDKTTGIDTSTRAMCDDIKKKSSRRDAKGNPIPDVKVFTVRVMEGNATLLRDCATNATMYKEVTDASQIDAVFKEILSEITALRLTM